MRSRVTPAGWCAGRSKLMLPLGFSLLALQGVSEIIKNMAAMRGHEELHKHYEKPMQ